MTDLKRGIRRVARVEAKKTSEIDKIDEMLRSLQERRAQAIAEREAAVEESFASAIRPTLEKLSTLFREACEAHVKAHYREMGDYKFNEEGERRRFSEIATQIFQTGAAERDDAGGEDSEEDHEGDEAEAGEAEIAKWGDDGVRGVMADDPDRASPDRGFGVVADPGGSAGAASDVASQS